MVGLCARSLRSMLYPFIDLNGNLQSKVHATEIGRIKTR